MTFLRASRVCSNTAAIARLPARASVEIFRENAFIPRIPYVLPQTFNHLRAITHWFNSGTRSASSYLLNTVGDRHVTVELRQPNSRGYGERVEMPFRLFVDTFCEDSDASHASTRDQNNNAFPMAYMAQCDLLSLAPKLANDVEIPPYIDASPHPSLYDRSVWLGRETHTPLHRDPNDNIFVQIAGKKRVRLYPPDCGPWLQIDPSLPFENTSMIGDAWDDQWDGKEAIGSASLDTVLDVGDGLFIPRGWWHTLKSEGCELTGSINWWFR